jgi:hypothetical protein
VTPAIRPGLSFLGSLTRRPVWLAAMALNGVAFVLGVVLVGTGAFCLGGTGVAATVGTKEQ